MTNKEQEVLKRISDRCWKLPDFVCRSQRLSKNQEEIILEELSTQRAKVIEEIEKAKTHTFMITPEMRGSHNGDESSIEIFDEGFMTGRFVTLGELISTLSNQEKE